MPNVGFEPKRLEVVVQTLDQAVWYFAVCHFGIFLIYLAQERKRKPCLMWGLNPGG